MSLSVSKGDMMSFVREWYAQHKPFCHYLMISVFVTILDAGASRIGEFFVDLILANSMGILVGFTVQYFLASRHVYNNKDMATFVKFLLTFFFGFCLANGIVYLCRTSIFHGSEAFVAFAVSKGLSIVIPFFVMYFMRKHWITTNKEEYVGAQEYAEAPVQEYAEGYEAAESAGSV